MSEPDGPALGQPLDTAYLVDVASRLARVPTNVPAASYQLLFSYGGETAQIATVTVR